MMYSANHFKSLAKGLVIDVIIASPCTFPFGKKKKDHLLEARDNAHLLEKKRLIKYIGTCTTCFY